MITDSFTSVDSYIQNAWKGTTLCALKDFIALPAKSPAFDEAWEKNGFLLQAIQDAAAFGQALFPEGTFLVAQKENKTPCLFVDIPGSQNESAVLFYGHLDKQPEAEGWENGREPFKASVEGNQLFGRGAVDDGYSCYAAFTALAALKENKFSYPRVFGLFETCEESGSYDLAFWLQEFSTRFKNVKLVLALDSGAADYDRLWISTSFRGLVGATLKVSVMRHGMHSGAASGVVPESFTIARHLLDRLEESGTGKILDTTFYADVPQNRILQLKATAKIVEGIYDTAFPLLDGVIRKGNSTFENLFSNAWTPQLSVIGADNLPSIKEAGNVLRAYTALRLSIRVPAHVDLKKAAESMKKTLLADVPFAAKAELTDFALHEGWDAPQEEAWFKNATDDISTELFGLPAAYTAEGGSIPILNLFSSAFPKAQFFVSGALGPNSNAHGPNEMLRLDYVEKLTCAIARLLTRIP